MKVLTIMGSPRKKGNGFKVIKKIEECMKMKGDIDFEYLYLKDTNLEMCRGCFLCVLRGEEACPVKDGRKALESKMLAADGVIFYSPVYGLNISGLMKTFMDRFAYNGHHPRFFKQNALYVATACGMGLDGAFRAFKHAKDWGFHTVGQLGLKCPHYELSEKATQKNDRAIEQAADKFYHALNRETLPEAQVHQIMQFNIMKPVMRTLADYKKKFPGDVKYWTENGWLEKNSAFFYETKLKIHHRMLGLFIRIVVSILAPIIVPK